MRPAMRLAVLAVGLLCSNALLAQPNFDFMPDGGKEMLARLAQGGRIRIEEISKKSESEEDWLSLIGAADTSLEASAARTLASYLALNMPTKTAQGQIERLPPDGKELALANCQSCHSLFSGYLTQERDAAGWRSIFKSPFHKELRMSEPERETFARYSAINMPIVYDKVPEELRF